MQLRQLQYFIRIVEEGSISRASQSLHVAQPALSQQVNHLEAELGVKLLLRSVRGVTPTAAGTAVYQQAQRVLRQVESTRIIAIQANTGPAGPVALGLPWTVASVIGLNMLAEVKAILPGIQLEIFEGPSSFLANLLARGKLDLAVVFDDTTDGGLELRPVVSEPLLFVGPAKTLTGISSITPTQIATYPLLLLSRPNGIRETLQRIWANENVQPSIAAEINAPRLLIDAVQFGMGYSVLPSCGLGEALSAERIDAVPITDSRLRRTIYLGTSRLYGQSMAAESILALVERLILEAPVTEQWSASSEIYPS